MEDTFDRLLERHTYDSLKSLFQAYFSNKHEALAAVCEDMTVPAMLERTGAVLLKNDEVMQDQLMCHHRAKWGMAFAPIDFEVYERGKFVSQKTATECWPMSTRTSGNASLKREDVSVEGASKVFIQSHEIDNSCTCLQVRPSRDRRRFVGGAFERLDYEFSQMRMFQRTAIIFGTARSLTSKMRDGRSGP